METLSDFVRLLLHCYLKSVFIGQQQAHPASKNLVLHQVTLNKLAG